MERQTPKVSSIWLRPLYKNKLTFAIELTRIKVAILFTKISKSRYENEISMLARSPLRTETQKKFESDAPLPDCMASESVRKSKHK